MNQLPQNKSLQNNNEYTAYSGIEESSLKEQIFKYLSNFHLFVFFVVITYSIAAIYLRYKDPVFQADARLFVKSGSTAIPLSENISDAFSKALTNTTPINLDNEIQLISSRELMKRAIEKESFHINYYSVGRVRQINMYKRTVFKANFIEVRDSSTAYTFYVSNINKFGGNVRLEPNVSKLQFEWNKPVKIGRATIQFEPGDSILVYSLTKPVEDEIKIVWEPVRQVANWLLSEMKVLQLDKKTTILDLQIKIDNPKRGEDILNAILTEYAKLSVERKEAGTKKTIAFIDERLNSVTDELKKAERDVNQVRIENKFFNLNFQKGTALNIAELNNAKTEDYLFQEQLIDLLSQYIKDGNNRYKTIPANFGLSEVSLNFYINNYNTLQAKRETDLLYLAPNSDLLIETENQLAELRNNIIGSLENLKKLNKLNIQQSKKLEKEKLEYLKNTTLEERELQEIERLLNLKERLFIFLLQKKEEMAIASSSVVSDYQQINPASASITPVEPDAKRIRIMAILIGLFIPFGLIYLQELLNDKITTKNDLVKKTPIPVLGEISHINILKPGFVSPDNRTVVGEQFRILRSNLQYILKGNPDNKVILITSSISGEGKSFVSFNLAAVLSLANKKVALLEFDLRKIRNFRVPGEPPMNKGLSNYLIGQINDHHQIGFSPTDYPNLTIFPSGPLPPNPAELILDSKVEQFIASLKEEYDYIILDSAPVGIIGDSLNLASHAQAVVYIIRQRYTLKKQIDFINDLWQHKKLGNQMSIVVNDVQVQGRYGYYGYTGYGYGYGYNYKYGNYGDNPYFDQEKKNWWKRNKGWS